MTRNCVQSVLAFFFFMALVTGWHGPAFAEISGRYSQGAVMIGSASDTCNAGIEGAIRYSSTSKVFEFCNATAWAQVASSSCTLASMTDVQITSPLDGQPLIYDGATSKWKNSVCDIAPNSVTFTDLTQQAVSTLVTSNIIQITGIGCAANVSISGSGSPEYRICSTSNCSSVTVNWTSAVSSISSGSYLQARLTTSPATDTAFTVTTTVGTLSDGWMVRTVGPKRVFVTSQTYTGDLGGLVGADSKCQTLADAANLGSTFKAWLSDSTTSASSRFAQSSLNYVMVNGTVVANGWSDLTDATIDNLLSRDENGTLRAAAQVWTNTTTGGAVKSANTSLNCGNWTESISGMNGYRGSTSWSDYEWTDSTFDTCDVARRLYCFEQ